MPKGTIVKTLLKLAKIALITPFYLIAAPGSVAQGYGQSHDHEPKVAARCSAGNS
jgi:hypothetical protein